MSKLERWKFLMPLALAVLFIAAMVSGAVANEFANEFETTTPQISFDRTIYNVDQIMMVTVTDGDSNPNGLAREEITVTITSANAGGSATKVLTETGVDTGIFNDANATDQVLFSTAAYSSADGDADNNATVQVTLDDVVTVSYTNPSGIEQTATRSVKYSTGSFNNTTTSLLLTDAATLDTNGSGNFTNTGDDIAYDGTTDLPITPTPFGVVYLTDPDLDTNTTTQQTPAVILKTEDGTTQKLTLQETAVKSGVFKGSFYAPYATQDCNVTEANGTQTTPLAAVIETSALGDVVSIYYTDKKDDGSSGTTKLDVPVGNGNAGSITLSAATATMGTTVTVTVTDTDLNQDPFSADTTVFPGVQNTQDTGEVYITSSVGGETDEVELTETGPDTGIFTKKVTFNPAEVVGDNDTELNVGPADVVTFTYRDANDGDSDPTNDDKKTTLTWNYSTGSVSVSPASVNDGAVLTVLVTDQDLNTNDTTVQTYVNNMPVVVVAKDSTADVEDSDNASGVTFTETSVSSGVFKHNYTVNFDEDANDNDGDILASLGGTIVATYTDANTVSGAGGTASASALVAQNVGLLTLSASSVDVNDSITVTLNDADLNTNGSTQQTKDVNVKSTTDGTGIALTLQETTVDSGIFSRSFTNAAASSAANRKLNVSPGDTITVTYADASPAGNRTATAVVTQHTGVLEVNKTHANLNDTVEVTLTETDLNRGAGAIDTVTTGSGLVMVKSNSDATGTAMLLTETGVDTSVFTGSFNTGAATAGGNVPTIKVLDGDNISVTYADAKNAGGTTQSIIVALTAGEQLGTISIPASLTLGETFTVQATDVDYNVSTAVANTLAVNVSTNSDPVGIGLTLIETGLDTGVFEKDVTVQTGASVPESSVMSASGDDLTVKYTDATDANVNTTAPAGTTVSATASVSEAQALAVSPADITVEVNGTSTADVSGGIGTKFISVEPSVATASYDSVTGVLTVTGVTQGTTSLTISDSATPVANTVDVPITVAPAAAAEPANPATPKDGVSIDTTPYPAPDATPVSVSEGMVSIAPQMNVSDCADVVTPIMYIWMPSPINAGVDLSSLVTPAACTGGIATFDLGNVDLTGYPGFVFDVYYGYVNGSGDIFYNVYEVTVQ